MVCPYCNNHPLPNSQVCNHCGIIFALAKKNQKPRTIKSGSSSLPLIFALIFGALVGALIGYLIGRLKFQGDDIMDGACIAGGVAVGAIIGFAIVQGRATFMRTMLTNKRRSINSEISKIESTRMEKLEQILGKPKDAADRLITDHTANLTAVQRLDLAAGHLITGEVDEGIMQLEQVYRQLTTANIEFLNNCGVAFARRGQLQVALDRFVQATNLPVNRPEPRMNLLYSIGQTRDKASVAQLLTSNTEYLNSVKDLPGGVNRLSQIYAVSEQYDMASKLLEQDLSAHPKDHGSDVRNDLGIIKAYTLRWRDAVLDFTLALQQDSGEACAVANLGLIQHNQGRPEEAAQRFSKALKIDPHNAKLHNLMGSAYCKLNFINEGVREFREARAHDPSLFEGSYNLGKVYLEQGILDQAEHCLSRAAEINPYSWHNLVAKAVLYFKQNRIQDAIDSYKSAHQAHPDEPIVLGGLALCLALEGDYAQADVLFKRALENNLRDADLLNNYGWFYILQEDIGHATEQLERILADIDKKHPHACANMGLCQHAMGAYDAAQQYFKTALAGNPTLGTIHYNLGCNYIDQRDNDNAIKSWELGKKTEGGNADLHTNLGVAYYKAEKFEKASAEFRRVLHLRQENSGDYANLGLTLARMKRHKEAIEQFELGIQIDDSNPMLHSNLGLACYFANRVEDAMREWGIVTRLNKQYALMRAKKQQSEYDDSSIAFIPLFVPERALYTPPRVPDFAMNFVPSYAASRYELIYSSDELKNLADLRSRLASTDRRIRAIGA